MRIFHCDILFLGRKKPDSWFPLILCCFITQFVLLGSCSRDPYELTPDSSADYDVFVVAGQSNTHFGYKYNPFLDNIDNRIWQLGRFDSRQMTVVPAAEPLDFISRNAERIGFSVAFAKKLLQHRVTDNQIIIIPCGSGGTGFVSNDWNPGDQLYEDVLTRTEFVLNVFPNSHLKGILWQQGEKEVNRNSPHFEEDLDRFIDQLRRDLGDTTVPFILGGMVPYWINLDSSRIPYQEVIKTRKDVHDYVEYADPELPFVIEKTKPDKDPIHYDALGQRWLAERYFQAYLRLVE